MNVKLVTQKPVVKPVQLHETVSPHVEAAKTSAHESLNRIRVQKQSATGADGKAAIMPYKILSGLNENNSSHTVIAGFHTVAKEQAKDLTALEFARYMNEQAVHSNWSLGTQSIDGKQVPASILSLPRGGAEYSTSPAGVANEHLDVKWDAVPGYSQLAEAHRTDGNWTAETTTQTAAYLQEQYTNQMKFIDDVHQQATAAGVQFNLKEGLTQDHFAKASAEKNQQQTAAEKAHGDFVRSVKANPEFLQALQSEGINVKDGVRDFQTCNQSVNLEAKIAKFKASGKTELATLLENHLTVVKNHDDTIDSLSKLLDHKDAYDTHITEINTQHQLALSDFYQGQLATLSEINQKEKQLSDWDLNMTHHDTQLASHRRKQRLLNDQETNLNTVKDLFAEKLISVKTINEKLQDTSLTVDKRTALTALRDSLVKHDIDSKTDSSLATHFVVSDDGKSFAVRRDYPHASVADYVMADNHDKLNGLITSVEAELVKFSAAEKQKLQAELNGTDESQGLLQTRDNLVQSLEHLYHSAELNNQRAHLEEVFHDTNASLERQVRLANNNAQNSQTAANEAIGKLTDRTQELATANSTIGTLQTELATAKANPEGTGSTEVQNHDFLTAMGAMFKTYPLWSWGVTAVASLPLIGWLISLVNQPQQDQNTRALKAA